MEPGSGATGFRCTGRFCAGHPDPFLTLGGLRGALGGVTEDFP